MKKNSGEKNTFLLYKDWKPLIDACTSEQAGDILKGIYAYVCEGDAPEFNNPLLSGFFEMIRQAIDENDSAWAEKREKAKKAIQARWEKKQAEAQKDPPKEPEQAEEPADAKPKEPTEDPNPQPAPETKKSQEPKQKPAALPTRISARTVFNACLMAYPISDQLKAAVETWLKYKTERRESYKEQGLRALMKKASEAEQKYGTLAVIDTIDNSIANRYQGIIWDRLRGRASPGGGRTAKVNQFTQMEQQQDYDFDALEKELSG